MGEPQGGVAFRAGRIQEVRLAVVPADGLFIVLAVFRVAQLEIAAAGLADFHGLLDVFDAGRGLGDVVGGLLEPDLQRARHRFAGRQLQFRDFQGENAHGVERVQDVALYLLYRDPDPPVQRIAQAARGAIGHVYRQRIPGADLAVAIGVDVDRRAAALPVRTRLRFVGHAVADVVEQAVDEAHCEVRQEQARFVGAASE